PPRCTLARRLHSALHGPVVAAAGDLRPRGRERRAPGDGLLRLGLPHAGRVLRPPVRPLELPEERLSHRERLARPLPGAPRAPPRHGPLLPEGAVIEFWREGVRPAVSNRVDVRGLLAGLGTLVLAFLARSGVSLCRFGFANGLPSTFRSKASPGG